MTSMLSGTMLFAGIIVLAFLIVLWIILPFAVFGIKSRLDCANRLLSQINDMLSKSDP